MPSTPVSDVTLPEGFPDLFVFKLRDLLQASMAADPDFAATTFLTRSIRPTDPTRSIGVIEGPASPVAYEISGRVDPSLMDWTVVVQVFAKHSNEVEGRNVRNRLLSRVRKTLFLPGTVSALCQLNDGNERVLKFRVLRFDFDAANAAQGGQFFLLGQVELSFTTELL